MPRMFLLGILLSILIYPFPRSHVSGLPLPNVDHRWQVQQQHLTSSTSCVLEGNSELYGLGIRLGVYFQLISTLLANHFLPDALREAWDANTIFLTSILIAIVKSSVRVGDLTAPEAFVMLQMLFAFLLAVYHVGSSTKWVFFELMRHSLEFPGTKIGDNLMHSLSELGRAKKDVSPLGTMLRRFLTIAIAAYNVWFWFTGSFFLDRDRACQSAMFLFARLNLHGSPQVLFRLLSTLYLLYQAFLLPGTMGWYWYALIRLLHHYRPESLKKPPPSFWEMCLIRNLDPRRESEKQTENLATKGDEPEWRKVRQTLDKRLYIHTAFTALWHGVTFTTSLSFIIWSILTIEFTLIWNNAQDVYSISSTGQLIPFITARKPPKPEQVLQKDSAVWKYRLNNAEYAVFHAGFPQRRRSFDDRNTRPSLHGLDKRRNAKTDRLAPVYPIPKDDENYRPGNLPGKSNIWIVPQSGRFLYWTKEKKSLHIFHSYTLTRRISLDDVGAFQQSALPTPHPARLGTWLPLSLYKDHQENESNRPRWLRHQQAEFHKAVSKDKGRDKLTGADSNHERHFWLPGDVDSRSFCTLSSMDLEPDTVAPKPRRWSFDEKDIAYPGYEDPNDRYPFETESAGAFELDILHSQRPVLPPGAYFPTKASRLSSSTRSFYDIGLYPEYEDPDDRYYFESRLAGAVALDILHSQRPKLLQYWFPHNIFKQGQELDSKIWQPDIRCASHRLRIQTPWSWSCTISIHCGFHKPGEDDSR
ncbi:uncharacterized protein PV07_08987 [Cladophialophora immunda]|uniref:Wax synthase domain-containing protein n=1 Tax=Cladophialophora immunda TaxID=569365 RepID=A0A0D2ALD7_9EURO|nr:uncharacterized protein PV07_08987 [Cladophialophora immunda]KIW25847.1 hypothetical protein PV07_08987 [Cladophialophora immunda]